MAVLSQSGPCITVLIRLVTYKLAAADRSRRPSLSAAFGITHETAGRFPLLAAAKKFERSWTLPNWLSSRTVSNHGSGFQMPGVWADWSVGGKPSDHLHGPARCRPRCNRPSYIVRM